MSKVLRENDYDGDGALSLREFLQFYNESAEFPGHRRESCYENLRNMNVRPDLVKYSEVVEQSLFTNKQLMPRFALQANNELYS